MRSLRSTWPGGLLVLALLSFPTPARAAAPASPVQLVPAEADFVLQVHQPRQLIEAFTDSAWGKQFQGLEAVRELYDSTNARRFYQLLAYFERELGASWPAALDRLAGGGAALAFKFGSNPAPTLLVIRGTDEELLRRFVKVGLHVIEQELARQEAKERPEHRDYQGVPTVHIGKDLHVAVAGATLLVSNRETALHKGLDLCRDPGQPSLAGSPLLAESRRLLPPNPLAALWLNLEPAHKAPNAKDVFDLPNNQPQLTVLVGGLIDVARRAPYVCAGLYRHGEDTYLAVRMPRGRDGLPELLEAHVPAADQVGSLPLLEPKGVLYSQSYFLDVKKLYDQRKQLLNERTLKEFENFDKNSGKFLLGQRFSKMVQQVGAHQRFVVANQHETGYRGRPGQRIPAFAYVVELREPGAFGKEMEAILRAAGLLTNFQVKMKLVEEKHGEHTIVGYRFPENAGGGEEDYSLRYNYSPCFVTVGDHFIASSTLELCHELVDLLRKEGKSWSLAKQVELDDACARHAACEAKVKETIQQLGQAKDADERGWLIDELQKAEAERRQNAKQIDGLVKQKEQKSGRPAQGSPAAARTQLYAAGGAEALQLAEDQLIAQTILNQALAPDAAREQVKQFIQLVRRLGVLQIETSYAAHEYRADVRLNMAR